MLGIKIFVLVQTFRPFAASRNFCHPEVRDIFSVKKIRSVYLVAELIRKFSGWLDFFFSVRFCLGSLCSISVSWSRGFLAVTLRNCCKKLPFIDHNFKPYFRNLFVFWKVRLVKNLPPTDWFNLSLATFGFFIAGEKIWFKKYRPFKSSPYRKLKLKKSI